MYFLGSREKSPIVAATCELWPQLTVRAVQSSTVRREGLNYAHRAMVMDRIDSAERLARIAQLIEEYRAAKQRRLLRRAVRLWRKTEARQRFVQLETPTHRVH